jgi:hypothetical protein
MGVIRLLQSSGDNKGGARTDVEDTEILNEVFDGVTEGESQSGLATYRCVYVMNGYPGVFDCDALYA